MMGVKGRWWEFEGKIRLINKQHYCFQEIIEYGTLEQLIVTMAHWKYFHGKMVVGDCRIERVHYSYYHQMAVEEVDLSSFFLALEKAR